jgi:flagellar biosynthesis GTPase FlhF
MDIQKSYKSVHSVKKLAPAAQYAHGNYSLLARLNGDLDNHMNPVYESLNGKGKLHLQDVTIKNFKPLNSMADKLEMPAYKNLKIQDAKPSFKIKNGKVHVEPFDIKTNDTKMNISGYNSLDQQVNYDIKMQVPREKVGGEANKFINNMANQAKQAGMDVKMGDKINLDVNVNGPFDNPNVKIVYGGMGGEQKSAKEQAKDKAKEEIDKKKEEAKERAEEEAEKQKEKAKQKAEEEKEKAEKKAKKEKEKAEDKAKEEADKEKDKAKEEAEDKLKDVSPF